MKRRKRGLVWMLCLCLAGVGILPPQAAAEALTLTPQQSAAFSSDEWAGYQPVLWRETHGAQYPDEPAQGEQGAMAVMRKAGNNVLCILAQAEDGSWRLVERADGLLRPGAMDGENGPRISAYALDRIEYAYEPANGRTEGGSLLRGEDGYAVVNFYATDAQGNIHSMYVEADRMELRWHGEAMAMEVRLEAADAYDRSIAAFDREAFIAYLASMYAQRNAPRPIVPSGSADTLPQGQVVAFAKGKSYDVYTGPGQDYLRAGDEGRGNATVSTNDWIQVLGREGDWLFIHYNLSDHRNRFGYISASALPSGASIADLAFARRDAVSMGPIWITDDPLRNVSEFEMLDHGENATWLATMGDRWVYIEGTADSGKRYRGFVLAEAIRLRSDFAGTAVVLADSGGEDAPIYAAASDAAPAAGMYRQGVQVRVLERGEDWTKVCVGDDRASHTGYMRTASLAFDIAPVDVPSLISDAQVYSADLFAAVPLHASPDAQSAQLGTAYPGTMMHILGVVGAWTHVVGMAYEENPGFLRTEALMPLPEYTEYAGDIAYVGPGGAALRLTPSDEATMLATFYEGMCVERIHYENGWAFVICRQPVASGDFKGYMRTEPFVSIAANTLPLATVAIQNPVEQGPCGFLRRMPHENGGDGEVVADGAKALVMGEAGDWRYVRVGGFQGYLHARDLILTGDTGNYEDTLYLGTAFGMAAPGDTQVRVYQYPGEDTAVIWHADAGAEFLLVAALDGWWQVESPAWYGTGFIPASSLQQP